MQAEQLDLYLSTTITSTIPARARCLMRDGAPIIARAPDSVARELADIAQAGQEMFIVLTLDCKNKILGRHVVSVGLLDTCPAHSREIFRRAILDNCKSIVLAHNHPSGDPTPSAEDIRLTRDLTAAGKLIGIPVLDHVIVGADESGAVQHHSMRESGVVNFSSND